MKAVGVTVHDASSRISFLRLKYSKPDNKSFISFDGNFLCLTVSFYRAYLLPMMMTCCLDAKIQSLVAFSASNVLINLLTHFPNR